MTKIASIGAGLALAALPALAGAQETRVIVRERPAQVLEIGGGVTDFTDGLDTETDPGGAWDVRAIFGTYSPVGFEIAYVGGLNDLNNTTGNKDASLMLTGGEAMLRLNLTTGDIQPFIAAGAGIHNYSIVDVGNVDTVNSEEFDDSTDVAVPAAAGIQAYLNERITVGGRVTYRYIFDDKIVADRDAVDAQSWAATARLGVAF